jgi:soluble lytic murein transglycosylase
MRALLAMVWAGLVVAAAGQTAAEGESRPLQLAHVTPKTVPAPSQTTLGARPELRSALKAARTGDIQRARLLARATNDPIAVGLVEWLWLYQPDNNPSFQDAAAFIQDHGDWPSRETLLRRAEEAIDHRVAASRVVAWFADRKPRTGNGFYWLASALLTSGQTDAARAMAREGWIRSDFAAAEEKDFYRRYGAHLTADDHAVRLDRLLWERQIGAAKRMLGLVGPAQRQLGEARLALMTKSGAVDNELKQVPPELRDDPGLIYERLRWRRGKDRTDGVEDLLSALPADNAHKERWWHERQAHVRTALMQGRVADAYRLAADHDQTEPRPKSEAEWLAGWIALRFLGDRERARAHFEAFQKAVRTPISLARGSYWLARTEDEDGKQDMARRHYEEAARFPLTFYGQLAALALDSQAALPLPPDPAPDAAARQTFEQFELVRAARLLAEAGEGDALRPFIMKLHERARTPVEHALVSELAREIGRLDLAVVAAKRAAQEGVVLVREGYPVPPVLGPHAPADATPDPALILAVSRQESEFDSAAVSARGARGLMQLMPKTAQKVARSLKMPYRRASLTADPAYNAKLGRQYLARLSEEWDQNYVLTLAAYNAGPQRVREWIEANGDPRRGEVDMIDWIELIPFTETRNYIQRVLESTQVYRRLLSPRAMALRISDDLHRGVVANWQAGRCAEPATC